MIQKFNTGIARRYGIAAALLAEAIWTEIKENEFHGRCQYDGENLDVLQPENVSDPYALSDKIYGQHGSCKTETGRRPYKRRVEQRAI